MELLVAICFQLKILAQRSLLLYIYNLYLFISKLAPNWGFPLVAQYFSANTASRILIVITFDEDFLQETASRNVELKCSGNSITLRPWTSMFVSYSVLIAAQ